jgi:hypothetical protein
MRRLPRPNQELPVPEPARATGLQSTAHEWQLDEEMRRVLLRRGNLYGPVVVVTNL